MSAHRINTKNFENGLKSCLGPKDWQKFFERHFGACTKAELLSFDWCNDQGALLAIEKRFEPRLVGSHLYWINPETSEEICIGYIDPQTEKGRYIISLNSEFGQDSEACFGKKNAINRLFEIFSKNIANESR